LGTRGRRPIYLENNGGPMEQRKRTRVETRKDATISWLHGQQLGEIVNLSMKGCLVDCCDVDGLSVGQPASVVIHLDPAVPHHDVRAQGRIARLGPSSLAIDFIEVEAASFHPLLRLVQYNATDPEGIERELSTFAFEASPPRTAAGE
jgi:hypothetical protein